MCKNSIEKDGMYGDVVMSNRIKKYLFAAVVCFFAFFSESASAESSYIVRFNCDIASIIEDTSAFSVVYEQQNLYKTCDLEQIQALEKYVVYYEKNETAELIGGSLVPTLFTNSADSEEVSENAQIEIVKAKTSWDFNTYGNGVNVAVIDSGCNAHVDIQGNIAGGYNYVSDNYDYSDNIGHGTHVCGIIAAENKREELIGVAPKAKIYILKCADKYISTEIDIIARALYEAVDKYNCRVINISLGSSVNSETVYEAVKYASNKGAVIVAAVGNKGAAFTYYPAGYDEVIGVGSVNNMKGISNFSQRNNSVFVVAPGENVKSLYLQESYKFMSGTSQATPCVSGIIAATLSANPYLTPNEIKEMIRETSEDLGDDGYDIQYGYGLINQKAIFEKIFDNNPYYLSPINDEKIMIYNNHSETLNALGIFAEYAANQLIDTTLHQICLHPMQKVMIDVKGEDCKFYLWKNIESIHPLNWAREELN